MRAHELDKFDQKILDCLSENARISTSELARKVNLSRTAVADRITRLEERNIIKGYTIRTGRGTTGGGISAYFLLTFNQPQCPEGLTTRLREIRGVQLVHATSGDIDLVVHAEADSMEALEQVREQLERLPTLVRISTWPVLKELINTLY